MNVVQRSFLCGLLAASLAGHAVPAGEPATRAVASTEEPTRIRLRNALAEYEFDRTRGYDLTVCRSGPGASQIGFTSACFVYCEAGTWKQECKAPPASGPGPDDFTDFRHEILDDAGGKTLRVSAHNDRLRLTKTFTLAPDTAALRIAYRIEATAPHQIEWGYTSLFRLARQPERWLLPENRVENGRVARRLALGPAGRPRTVGNQEFYPTTPDAVGVCYPTDGTGVLFINAPESPLTFRSGERTGQSPFVGLRFEVGQFSAAGVLTSAALLVPLSGDPLTAAGQALAVYRAGAEVPGMPAAEPSGHCLATLSEGVLWTDVATAKVLPDEPPPSSTVAAVEIAAARGEFEPFQLALRPTVALPAVRLECSPLSRDGKALPETAMRWNPLACYPCAQPLTVTDIVGEIPDALQPAAPTDCPAGRTQSFWVTVQVPREAAPGLYEGTVRVLTADRLLGSVPLRLTVRGFALPEERSLAAFLDPWRQCVEKHYGKDKTAAVWPPFCEHLAEHRAAPLHPAGGGPTAAWDDQGQLTSFDGAPLDAALEAYWRDYRMPVAVLGTFTLGWGHLPRDNRFGKAADILSPLWQARCASYATALRDHLRAKGWADKVVFSLFDEPSPEYYPLITGTVGLLRGIAPEWRFTYWGNHAPQLDGAIRVWTIPMESYTPRLAQSLRARGDTLWVYNPPGYRVSSSALAARMAYWWMWREHVDAVYQWTITAWVEWTGNEHFWDPYRNASWVVPGPEAPLDTVRFELAREGLEDYEYLVLLEKLTTQAETRGLRDAATAGRRLLEESRGIAWAPEDGRTTILHTRDPRQVHDLRDRLGAAITSLTAALQP